METNKYISETQNLINCLLIRSDLEIGEVWKRKKNW